MKLVNLHVTYFVPRSDMSYQYLHLPSMIDHPDPYRKIQIPVADQVRDVVWAFLFGRVNNARLGVKVDARHV